MAVRSAKKILLFFCFLIALNAMAQSPVPRFNAINENSVVKDSAGKQLAFTDWQKLIKEGSYTLHPVDPSDANTSYLIAKKTALEARLFKASQQRARFNFNQQTILTDSAGKTYAYPEWSALVNSGDYALKAISPTDSNSKFVLAKLTAKEKEEQRIKVAPSGEAFKIGETFKNQILTDIYGLTITPRDWAGKTVVLNFWFIDCAPCRQEIPELSHVADGYAGNPNIIFIAIARDKVTDVKKFIKQTPFNYRQVGNGKVYADELKIEGFPTNVVINKNGMVAFTNIGFAPGSNNSLIKAIAKSVSQ